MKDVINPDHVQQRIRKALFFRNVEHFFKNLCSLIDFIDKEPFFRNLCWKWDQDQKKVTARIHSLELQVYTKSKMTFEELKQRISQSQLVDSKIDEKIQELEKLFNGQETCCPPFPWRLAYDGVKELGFLLEGIKRFDLLDGFVIVQNSIDVHGELFIEYFPFAEGVTELVDLHEEFFWKVESDCAVWQQLLVARWCYQTPFTYWERKKIRYDNRYARKGSWERINLHTLWCEMNAIKRDPKYEKALFFRIEQFKSYLKKLSHALQQYSKKYMPITFYHLRLYGDCLWVILEIEVLGIKPFMIKQFKEYSDLHLFAQKLGNPMTIPVPNGYSASSLLDHLNMPISSQLAMLYFNDWDSTHIKFKGTKVSGEEIENRVYVPDLLQELHILQKRYQSKDHLKFPSDFFVGSSALS